MSMSKRIYPMILFSYIFFLFKQTYDLLIVAVKCQCMTSKVDRILIETELFKCIDHTRIRRNIFVCFRIIFIVVINPNEKITETTLLEKTHQC
jgi:hypothetical protein